MMILFTFIHPRTSFFLLIMGYASMRKSNKEIDYLLAEN